MRGASDAGFTLLETIVALAIASMALIVLFQTGSGGLFAVDTASRAAEALERAQSHLAAVGAGSAPVSGDTDGDDGDGYHWHLHAQPAATRLLPEQYGNDRGLVTLFDITVSVTWPSRHHDRAVVLTTQRLIAPVKP